MNRKEIKEHLSQMEKDEVIDIVLGINANFPSARKFISEAIRPPETEPVDWDEEHDNALDLLIEFTRSDRMNTLSYPDQALKQFTKHKPDRDVFVEFFAHGAQALVEGLVVYRRSSLRTSAAGQFVDNCFAYMKKRKWDAAPLRKHVLDLADKYFEQNDHIKQSFLIYSGLD